MVFSTLIAGLAMLPISLVITGGNISPSIEVVILSMLSAIIYSLAVFLYFVSLEKIKTSSAIALLQLIPVFSFIISIVIFKEEVGAHQIMGGLVVIIATIIASGRTRDFLRDLRSKPSLAIIVATLLFATYYKIFEHAEKAADYGTVVVFFQLGWILTGSVLMSRAKYRDGFMGVVKTNGRLFFGVNVINEGVNNLYVLSTNYAIVFLSAPIVTTMAGSQMIFSLLIALVGGWLWPKFFDETFTKAEMLKKLICSVFIVVGLYVMLA